MFTVMYVLFIYEGPRLKGYPGIFDIEPHFQPTLPTQSYSYWWSHFQLFASSAEFGRLKGDQTPINDSTEQQWAVQTLIQWAENGLYQKEQDWEARNEALCQNFQNIPLINLHIYFVCACLRGHINEGFTVLGV